MLRSAALARRAPHALLRLSTHAASTAPHALRRLSTHAASTASALALEDQYCARTYSPLPFCISHAKGIMTWSPEGTQRMDFLSAFSAVNQGHCHPVRAPLSPSRPPPRRPRQADLPAFPSPAPPSPLAHRKS